MCLFYRLKWSPTTNQSVTNFIIWLTDFPCCDCSVPGPLVAVRTSSSRSLFQNRHNQQSHIVSILLASFARSVRQVMDPRFFLPCFHGPCALCLGHKRKEKTWSITCCRWTAGSKFKNFSRFLRKKTSVFQGISRH